MRGPGLRLLESGPIVDLAPSPLVWSLAEEIGPFHPCVRRYGEVPEDEPEDADPLDCYQEVNLGDMGITRTDGLWARVGDSVAANKHIRVAVPDNMDAVKPLPYPPDDDWANGRSFP